MSTKQMPTTQPQFSSDMFDLFGPAMDYAIDAGQRTVLFWDVMRHAGTNIASIWPKLCRMCLITRRSSSSMDAH
jgi:hypothetical protein